MERIKFIDPLIELRLFNLSNLKLILIKQEAIRLIGSMLTGIIIQSSFDGLFERLFIEFFGGTPYIGLWVTFIDT